MTEDPLKLLQHWLDQLEAMRERSSTDAGGATSTESFSSEVIALLTRQSDEFSRFAHQLLEQFAQSGRLSFETFDQLFLAHLEKLTQQWLISQCNLPELGWMLCLGTRIDGDKLRPNPLLEGLERWLEHSSFQSLPTTWKQLLNKIASETRALEKTFARLLSTHLNVNQRALEQFHHLLDSQATIESITQLHQLWCTSYESVYAAQLAEPEFQQLRAQLINHFAELQLLRRQATDNLLELADLPSSGRLHKLGEQLGQHHRELRRLKRQQRSEQQRMQAEINALRDQVAQLTLNGKPDV